MGGAEGRHKENDMKIIMIYKYDQHARSDWRAQRKGEGNGWSEQIIYLL